jgi:membrane fusion protein, multidrug efflux system
MIKRMVAMLLVVGIIFGGIFGYQAFKGRMMKKMMASGPIPAVVVSASKAEMLPWQSQILAVGSVKAVRGLDVASEVPGLVQEVKFNSCDEVKAGQELLRFNIDPDLAQLRQLKINEALARIVYGRDKKQIKVQAISQAQLDADTADLKNKIAQVAVQRALIDKKIIKAPFAGRLGISSINPGQYLNPGDKIVTLQSLDTVYFDFYLPQQELSRLSLGQKVDLTTDAYPKRSFTGKIPAVNPRVETDSRNVLIEATVANPGHELLPGMYASVEVEAGQPKPMLTVPQTAVIFNPYGETIYVVEEQKGAAGGKSQLIAKQRFVTVGQTRGDQVTIITGLKEGELVVTSGQIKLRNNSPVVVNNEVQPANDAAPNPVDQ